MKKFFLFLFCLSFCLANVVSIDDFSADLYSKSNSLRKIQANLQVVTRDDEINEAAIYDALNIIISSFFVEDILTGMGKEKFKSEFIRYASKKYGIDIDDVFILKLNTVDGPDINKIIKAIKERDLCGSDLLNQTKTIKANDLNSSLVKEFGREFN